MKRLKNWLPPTMTAVGLMPLGLLIGANAMADRPWLAVVPMALLWLSAMLLKLVPGKLRVAAAIILCAVQIAVCAVLLPVGEKFVCWLIPVSCIISLLVLLPQDGSRAGLIYLGTACVVLHVIGQMLLMVAERQESMVYEPVEGGIHGLFVAFLLLAMLCVNRSSLEDAATMGIRPPAAMRRKNTILTVAFTVIVLLIAAIPAVVEAFRRAWHGLILLIMKIAAWLGGLFSTTQSGEPMSGDRGMPGLGAGEPSTFALLMEKVIVVIALLAAAVGAVFLLVFLIRKLIVLAKFLWKKLKAYASAASGDYVDEVSETREWGEILESVRSRLRRKPNPLRGVDEAGLSPRERVRFNYLKLQLKHPEWKDADTARQNLNSDAVSGLYERARYSEHEITSEEAERFAGESTKM